MTRFSKLSKCVINVENDWAALYYTRAIPSDGLAQYPWLMCSVYTKQ